MGDLVGSQTVRDFVEVHAVARPDKLFLVSPDNGLSITYGDLRDVLADFSNRLAGLGIRHQQVVSVMMQNSWGSVQVILGTLYCGRITAPINLAAGDPQIAYVIEHSETEIIFVSPEEAPRLRRILEQVARPIRVIPCDPHRGPEWPEACGAITPIADHDNMADGLLMYTSGTSGDSGAEAERAKRTISS